MKRIKIIDITEKKRNKLGKQLNDELLKDSLTNFNKPRKENFKDRLEEIILECLEFDEAEDSFDGISDTDGGIDSDWIYRVQKNKFEEILKIILSHFIPKGTNIPKDELMKQANRNKVQIYWGDGKSRIDGWYISMDDLEKIIKEMRG